MNLSKIIKVVVAFLLLTIIIMLTFHAIGLTQFIYPFNSKHKQAKNDIIKFMNKLNIGDTHNKTKTEFNKLQSKHLEMIKLNRKIYMVRTPFQAGAINWILWIEFDSCSNTITKLMMRLEDSKEMKPKESPPDRKLLPKKSK